MTTYQWLLRFTSNALKQLRKLPSKDRMAVFDSIAELCTNNNPPTVSNVKKMRSKRFAGLYRRRKGDYRILFQIEVGEIEDHKHIYKGILRIIRVLPRDDVYK